MTPNLKVQHLKQFFYFLNSPSLLYLSLNFILCLSSVSAKSVPDILGHFVCVV